MSTPMRHGPSQQGRTPSQQGRTPSQHPAAAQTPQASTPFSTSQAAAALSPHGPRSSPQQLKKSPAMATVASTSGTMSGTMSSTGNPPINFDSPSAAAALGGLSLGDLNLDNISVGGLVGAQGRSDEDDRKKRMDAVINKLWSFDSSRVSNEGLERLAGRLGLECLWENAGTGSENDKILIIAGRTMGVEVSIKNHVVYHASLTYNEPSPSLDKHVEKASAILFQDLALGPGESQLTKKLTKFRVNLDRLATLDRLSITPGLNCHEAVAGVWESLEKLHRWDVERMRDDPAMRDYPEENLRVLALCNGHGCPLMHTRGRIGLSLDYWKEYRAHGLPLKHWKQYRAQTSTTVESEKGRTWSILIECAPANSMVYSPIRVSNKWIGPEIVKTNPTDDEVMSATGPILDWLEPNNTLLPSTEETKAESGPEPATALSRLKPPEVVFMASFDPPLVVTQSVAMEIYKISATNAPLSSTTFDALLFPVVAEAVNYDPSEPRELTFAQVVPTLPDLKKGQTRPVLKTHRNTLLVDKPIFGQVLGHIPFSHPKDLVAMLPTLRQYAFLSLLLANSFKPREPGLVSPEIQALYDAGCPNSLRVDVVVSVYPVPRLQLVFPFKQSTAMIHLEIQLNGKVHIISDNIFSEVKPEGSISQLRGKGTGRFLSRIEFAEKLEVCENIGRWIEFIKYELE